LALDQFIDALKDPDMRLRIREARPYNINEAEILAVRLETFKQADNHRGKMLGIACNYRQIQKCRYGKGY
jgi:hypothetical protein